MNFAIVGVGLIGGSFGLALRKAGFSGTITGVSSEATLRAALERGAIDEGAPLADAAAQADLIFLAQPIGRILDTLRRIDCLVRPGTLITDAGSTKALIVSTARQHIRNARFVGGHPLAGKEKRGVGEADADLFQGRTWVLTPDGEAPHEFLELLGRIGAQPALMTPEEHDRTVAFTSHLPQLASTALAALVADNVQRLQVAGPGLAGITRLALSDYDVWRDILATNAEAIDKALAAYIAHLEHMRENLRTREMQEEFEIAARLAALIRR